MKEKRLFWQLTVLLLSFFSCFILWHLLRVLSPNSERPHSTNIPLYTLHTEFYNYTHPLAVLSPNDYNSLVNYTFTFDVLNMGCDDTTLLLVLIHSSPRNLRKRNIIRKYWGKRRDGVKLFFILGKAQDLEVTKSMEEENRSYRDLVQGDFVDSYRNLTYKHITTLKYAIYHCPQAKYVLKTDDDVFVNIPTLKQFLTVGLSPYGASNVLFCSVKKHSKVMRSYRSKWRVAFEEYPYRFYPPYCPGWVILYTPDVVFRLYKMLQSSSDIFWIDDVYITGTIAAKTNVSLTDIQRFILPEKEEDSLVDDGVSPKKPFLFGQPDLTEAEIKRLWEFVTSREVPNSYFESVRTMR